MTDEFDILSIPEFEGETIEELVDTIELFVLLNNFPFKDEALNQQDIQKIRSIAPVIDALNKLRLVAYSIDGKPDKDSLH